MEACRVSSEEISSMLPSKYSRVVAALNLTCSKQTRAAINNLTVMMGNLVDESTCLGHDLS